MKTNLKSEDQVEDHIEEETKNGPVLKAEGASHNVAAQGHKIGEECADNNLSTFGQVLQPVASPSKSECEKLLEKAVFEPEGASQNPPTAVKTDELDGPTIANGE